MSTKNLILIMIASVILFGCCQKERTNDKTVSNLIIVKENFYEFSKLFYTDSLFQIKRINFPLKGEHNIDVENSLSNELGDSTIHGWERENWIMLRNVVFQGNDTVKNLDGVIYRKKIQKKDTLVTESEYIEDSGFEIIKKFSLNKGKWYLIYYSVYNN